jgi:predicted outer membrane protein
MLISHLSARAALFAVLATGSIAIAADRSTLQPAAPPTATAAAAGGVVQLPLVVVTGRRLPAQAR